VKRARLASLETLPAEWRGGVVAIGNFDGMHLGHQTVLAAARGEAERLGVPCLMLTFEPHPRAFFSGRPIFRLTPAPLKAALAAALGLDGTLVIPFDRTLAETSAEDFVSGMLVDRLAIRAAVTGYDFHFGKARRGTPRFLAEEGRRRGFSVEIVDALRDGADAVSATRVRASLSEGDVTAANELLGWSFAVSGEVARGDGRGRELGYPTANMALDAASEIAHGIYAVRFLAADGVLRDGVASYGRRPTFGGGEPVLETFVFDFSGNLYGETALVAFHAFIRAEERFDSVAALVAQMDSDSIDARAILERMPPGDLDHRLHAAWSASLGDGKDV
jgi:riboflavin kinase / FMN adenylyltransferase